MSKLILGLVLIVSRVASSKMAVRLTILSVCMVRLLLLILTVPRTYVEASLTILPVN